VETVRRAVGLGVNWTDTAANYGLEHSEEVVGRAIKELPGAERPLVFTRGGLSRKRAIIRRRLTAPDFRSS